MDRKSIIDLLVGTGHSPTKALEIAIDAERGEIHALQWINQTAKDAAYEAMKAALATANEALTEYSGSTSSFCEICERHAPKDGDGALIGTIEHRPDCPVTIARAALRMAEQAEGESDA